jgi:hypothetical protein
LEATARDGGRAELAAAYAVERERIEAALAEGALE